ncbi:MAG: hypothetical protein D3908_15630 [Candidatus Electrothrix sp. AUS4]|nr:hypothetical protein [Candidatus Electrothrix sp. AUS4]
MKIALAQINPIIGNFSYNRDRVVEQIRLAEEAACGLVVFPELTLCGYPPQDLLERPAFLRVHDQMLEELVGSVGEIGVILGVPEQRQGKGKPLYNSALLIHQGRCCTGCASNFCPPMMSLTNAAILSLVLLLCLFSFRGCAWA